MAWIVTYHRKVEKELGKLPVSVQKALYRLAFEIELSGPVSGNWQNYAKLDGNRHHCHLKKGKPTYVAVWTEDKEQITVEVVYAGTHEKAPY